MNITAKESSVNKLIYAHLSYKKYWLSNCQPIFSLSLTSIASILVSDILTDSSLEATYGWTHAGIAGNVL